MRSGVSSRHAAPMPAPTIDAKNQAYEGSIKWWQLRTIGQRGKHGGRHDRCEIGDGREVRRHAGRD